MGQRLRARAPVTCCLPIRDIRSHNPHTMDPTALALLTALAPDVHELDQASALEACGALVARMRARKLYHERTRATRVDVAAGEVPRLTNKPEDGPPAPLADKTLKNFQANVRHVFRGVVGACTCTSGELCTDCAERLKTDEAWFLAVDDCLEWAYKNQDGGEAATRTALERVLSMGQLCDMHHSPESMRARDLYRKHVSGVRNYHEAVKRRRTDDEALVIATPPAETEAAPAEETPAAQGAARTDPPDWAPMQAEPADTENAIIENAANMRPPGAHGPPRAACAPDDAASDATDGPVQAASDQLAAVRANLRAEYDVLVPLAAAKPAAFVRAARKWLLFAPWLGVGELYEDDIMPMRTDLEGARFGHELDLDDQGRLWFDIASCAKVGARIRFCIDEHSAAVAHILKLVRPAALVDNDGILFPMASKPTAVRSATQNANSRKAYARQGKAYGLPEGKHTINAMRHISKRDMPPRTPDEARDFALRRGSSQEAMMKYGGFATHATSM